MKSSFYKHGYAALSLVLLALIVVACGGGEGDTAQPSSAARPESASASPSASPSQSAGTPETECREISHPQGTACVPLHPEKTLVLFSEYADYMLAIGETPYAVLVTPQYNNELLPYLRDRLPDVKLLEGGTEGLSLEAILALQPDLILADGGTAEKEYGSLSKIAPTVVLGDAPENPLERWKTDLQKVAETFGKPEAATQALEELRQSVAEAKEQIAQLSDKRIAFIRVREKELQLYGTEGHPLNTLLYGELGLQPSSLTQPGRVDLSQELIPELDADYLFLQTDGKEGDDYLAELSGGKLWQSVPAVRENRTFKTDYWLYLSWGVLGQKEIVRELLQDLEVS
ncbi:ABC transporter substrate-binding protein [Cohnella cellulosilytica]|uniref:ABC transporter substrate-binding protein n=1 Tax=Cohnella cellulosilytica TaxID=986710 RepID=A0ABW2F5I2_9BACL